MVINSDANILRTSSLAGQYDQAGQYRVLCAHISQVVDVVRPQSLSNYLQEENTSEVKEEPATVDFAWPKQ
jgi:hypothetical protein